MINISVYNCQTCPFVKNDNDYGFYGCNISDAVTNSLSHLEELPKNDIHKYCPLKNNDVVVTHKKVNE